MTTTINAADAQDQLPDLINQVVHSKEHILLTRRGKEIAALIPIDDLILLQEVKNKKDIQEALEALKETREQGSIDLEKLKEELGNEKP